MSDDQQGYPGAPPGWYADPAGGLGQRWWDGYAWSDAVTQPVQAPPAPPPWAIASTRLASSQTMELVNFELSITPMARITLAYPGLSAVIAVLFARVYASQLRDVGHQFHLSFIAAQNNLPAPTLNFPTFTGPMNTVFSVNGLLALAALIISLVWQHRAASAARALGLPGRLSPAWGVGSWFVPVISLWFPYRALVDCLAPTDPNRSAVLRYWLCAIGASVGNVAIVLASLFSSGAALVLSVPVALLAVGVLAAAPKVVLAIASSHRALSSNTP